MKNGKKKNVNMQELLASPSCSKLVESWDFCLKFKHSLCARVGSL